MTNETSLTQLIRRGTTLLQRGQHIQATELLTQAFEEHPDSFDAALNLGAAYIMGKKFKQAIVVLEPLIEQEENNAMLWTNLGAAYLGNPVLATDEMQLKAVDAFIYALKINPSTPNVAYNIGLIHKDRQEKKAAIQWFTLALSTNPNDKDARYWIDQLGTA